MSTYDFYVPQLNTDSSGQLLTISHLDASNVTIGTYQVAYKIDIKESVAREMFRFSVYNSTLSTNDLATNAVSANNLTTASDADVGFYIQTGKFPAASPNYTAGDYTGSAAPLNPLLASSYLGHISGSQIDDANRGTIAQEYMSYAANVLFTTAKASALFNNESDFIKKTANQPALITYYKTLYDSSGDIDVIHKNTLTTAQILANTQLDLSSNPTDARSRNKLARNLFYSIAGSDGGMARLNTVLTAENLDAATNTYPIPVNAGDTFNSFVTIKPCVNQNKEIFGGSPPDTLQPRKYRIVLNIVANTVTPVYNPAFQRSDNVAGTAAVTSWPVTSSGVSIKDLSTIGSAISLNA